MAFNRRPRRVRKCKLCSMKVEYIDYKNTDLLKDFINEKGKIIPKRLNGNCAKHQRMVKTAIKRARQMALLPFVND
ncbi:SSU ribosomal protein S18P [Marinitoga hydrogenitolerans DSM 16785]|uniref:Small ribosomal subunit protein bS18 n=1 Tax=Marinitoga hydrogenitolerans (strain DSM 16785 / JCM 12826 / AT1271) TaxID=1122195 RepID=A0A1M4XMB2_MARH1|nr:30S ribosomal protein S18 [Marinitoga hydrogenitolerans]SHE94570.1 SSU ribosomal protein S18P [Marinitoga hydrogenitolerans DSM 16785]